MKNLKLITTLILAFAFLFAQVGNVAAAPLVQDPTTSVMGTVQSIVVEEDAATGDVTVLVTLVDDQGATQTVRISEATAITQGLLQVDSAGNLVLDQNGLPVPVVLDPNTPLSVSIPTGDIISDEEDVHPISDILADFFEVDASLIDSYHNGDSELGVFGFGVIAQALWMAENANSDFTFEDILKAKKVGSGTFTVNGQEITYTNWGQFKKALIEKHNSLGSAKHAEEDETSTESLNGHGHGKNKNNDNGQGHGHGNGHNTP